MILDSDNHPAVECMSVVMPVHDEESTLDAAIRAIVDAARNVDVPVCLTVVLDRCTDGSAAVADHRSRHAGGVEIRTLSGYFPTVGAVRNAGVADAAAWGADNGVHLERHWTAHTDADSLVPDHWLFSQLTDADAGHDLVIGTVVPDEPTDSDTARLWAARHTLRDGHRGIHGANLGIRLSHLLGVGGFAGLSVGEDVETVHRLKESGAVWTATDRARVLTSARRDGRVAGGFADYLRQLDDAAKKGDPAVKKRAAECAAERAPDSVVEN